MNTFKKIMLSAVIAIGFTSFGGIANAACGKVVENGSMTKDLAVLVGKNQKYLTTNQFIEVLDSNLKRSFN